MYLKLRPLLAILQTSSPASVKFLETQLGFGEGRLVLEVETPQRIVQLGDRTEAAPQYPPLHQRREHYTEHQDRDHRSGDRRRTPPREGTKIVHVLLVRGSNLIQLRAGRLEGALHLFGLLFGLPLL